MHTALLLGLTELCDDTAHRPGSPIIRLARGLMELYEIICRACSALFHIHRCCYRGHAYCGESCRTVGRRRTANASGRTHRESEEGRLDHLYAERDRRRRRMEEALREDEHRGEDDFRVADHGSNNLTQPAHLVGESEVQDEKRTDGDAARVRAWRSLHEAAAPWDVAHGVATPSRGAARAGAGLLERLAGFLCVVCGRGGSPLVPMVDGPSGGHLRAAPGVVLSSSTA